MRVWRVGAVVTAFCLISMSAGAQARDPAQAERERLIEQKFALGQTLLQDRQYAAARDVFESILRLDSSHRGAKRLLTTAQRKQAAQRKRAVDVALDLAREKARQRADQSDGARRQIDQARDRQMKTLYKRGRSLYHQGRYAQAVEAFEQLIVLDPRHPLASEARRLIAKAESALPAAPGAAQAGAPSRRAAAAPTTVGAASNLTELEDIVAAKRLEQETALKHAKLALRQRRTDRALELARRVLADDPANRQAQQLLHEAELAGLKQDEAALQRRVEVDEQRMMNDVARSELLDRPSASRQAPSATPARVEPDALSPALQQPISFEFQDVALGDVVDFLADAAAISVIPSPRLDLKQQRVSLKVDKLPLGMALKYLVKQLGLVYRVDEGVVLIASPEEFGSEPLETRVFFLQSGLGPFALETSAVATNPVLALDPLRDLIEQSVSQPSGSKLFLDERSGSLIVTNTADNLQRIEELLGRLDITPLQVLIEARFVEVTFTDLEQMAFESVLTGDAALNKKGAADGTRGPGHALAKSGGVKFPSLSRETEALNLTLQGVLTGTQFEAALHLLDETKKSKTLSAPRVTALNNQPATIKVVEEFNYPTRYEVQLVQFDINGDGDFDDAGETEFANVPVDLQTRDIGILLHVIPSVGRDLKTITLVLAPEVSQFSEFRDLGGGVSVPAFTASQITTTVAMQDGCTIVLGGLMTDALSETLTKVPWLGDLPLLGGLFRQREESQTRKTLLIFVTARLLAPRGQTI